MIFSLFPIFLSLSLSFLLHAFNFKKHFHSFLGLLTTTFNTTNNATDNNYNKLHIIKCHHPISSTATTHSAAKPVPLPPPSIHDIDGIDGLMVCTESIGFESIDERIVDDQIDHENDDDGGEYNYNNDSDDEYQYEGDCWRRGMRAAEGRGNTFPPPLSSLDGNGQPSFILLPVRKNGRLQLSKVRIKRPEILCATRHDGRLRLYLVPDQCVLDDVEQEECEAEEEEKEEEVVEKEEITIVESEEEEEIVEETRYEEDDRVREWKLPTAGDNGRFRRCYELVNHIHCIHHVHSHHNLHMFGLSIA